MIMYVLIIAILVVSAVSTLLIAGKGDENYSSSTKRNYTNLTIIYTVIIIIGLIALAVYIRFYT
ncbi:hypothetical protein [Niallia sp. Krafla_26]|uniref:hypothetical protein n=1 Tax=Niallia sp. Krafla_26 TaxID=3064703 RepID=UPI003D1857F4